MDALKGVKAIIFDLDGTLYQENEIMCYDLIREFVKGSPYEPLADEMIEAVNEILEGKWELKCGHFVEKKPVEGEVSVKNLLNVPSVSGLSRDNVYDYFDRKKYSHIGDGCTLAMFIGHRLNLSSAEFWIRFNRVRKKMLIPGCGPGRSGLVIAMMNQLRDAGIRLLLCTNSSHKNSNDLLLQLGLLDRFDEVIHDAHKPAGLADRIELLKKYEGLQPEEILLVGDQGYNDLFMGYQMGTRTMLVSDNVIDDGIPWTYRVHTVEEMAEALHIREPLE